MLAVRDASCIEGSANHLVAHAGKVLDATSTNQHNGVLLKIVSLAGDVAGDLDAVGDPHTGDLAQSRVRLLRGHGCNSGADATTLGSSNALLVAMAGLQTRRGHLLALALASFAD